MNKPNITFSEVVKNEICHLEYNDATAYYLLLSFLINNSEFCMSSTSKGYIVHTHFLPNVRLIKSLLSQLKFQPKIELVESNIKTASAKTKYALEIDDFEAVDKFFKNYEYQIKAMNEDEQRAFVVGAFLSGGSVSYSTEKSNYHFEIRSRNKNYLENILNIFKEFNIEPNIVNYRNAYKLYFKRSEYISDTLKLLGAHDALYEFEDFRIQRDFINSQQRLNNLDVSNINKTVIASNNQVKWIQTLKNKYAYERLDDKTKIFCDIRLEEREASLETIAQIFEEKYDIKLTKSSINHMVRKIKSLYLQVKDK